MTTQMLGWIGWITAIPVCLIMGKALFSEGLDAVRQSKPGEDRASAIAGPYTFALGFAIYVSFVLTAYCPIWGDHCS